MPWKGVTVSEQRRRFLEDYHLNYYSITELAERFGISRTTAYTHPHPSGTSGTGVSGSTASSSMARPPSPPPV